MENVTNRLLSKKKFFWSSHRKNPTKHPVDLPPLTLGHLKNFQVSIFEFQEATQGWKPEVKMLDPYEILHFKFLVSFLS